MIILCRYLYPDTLAHQKERGGVANILRTVVSGLIPDKSSSNNLPTDQLRRLYIDVMTTELLVNSSWLLPVPQKRVVTTKKDHKVELCKFKCRSYCPSQTQRLLSDALLNNLPKHPPKIPHKVNQRPLRSFSRHKSRMGMRTPSVKITPRLDALSLQHLIV